jgi:hypothetical protein
MLDLVRAGLLLALFVATVRARHVVGTVLASLVLVVFAVEVSLPLTTPAVEMPAMIAIGSVILGPSVLPSGGRVGAILADPQHHLVCAALLALGARVVFARSRALPPHRPEAYRYDQAALRFVGAAVLYGLLSVSGLLFRLLFTEP